MVHHSPLSPHCCGSGGTGCAASRRWCPAVRNNAASTVIPVHWHNVTQNALCLSAHSWKVTVNDECSCVGTEEGLGMFFSSHFFFPLFPMNCITWQSLGFIHLTPVVTTFPNCCEPASSTAPLWPKQDIHD